MNRTPAGVLALLALLTVAQHASTEAPLDWWQTDVIYQIYPRSFKDSNGDGIGDLKGITEKADYLKSLGIGAIWISPIFKSPMADFGYDIADFRAIEPIFGTMEDFKILRDTFHEKGIKVILDFVPNHSSDEHEWFQKSVQNIAPYSDYYVWVDAKYVNGTRTPPSNWLSYFEGSAWTWNENRQKYYLHQYHPKQPDLNYRNPAVMKEMQEVLRFWLDLGVDGFRVDTVFTLVEDDRYLDEPRSFIPGLEPTNIGYLDHIYTKDQPGTYDVIYQFRAFLDEYQKNSTKPTTTKFMATEAYSTLDDTMRYYGNATNNGSHFPFNFLLTTEVDRQSEADFFKSLIDSWYEKMPAGRWANWVIGNHDKPRAASRFGRDMLDSIHMIQFLIPGTVVTYMGDEIAMKDAFIRWKETVDPPGVNSGKRLYTSFSRDPERSPFLWDDTLSAGFSSNRTTWLPIHPNYWDFNLAKQEKSPKSHLSIYKRLLKLKSFPVIQRGSVKLTAPNKNILVIERRQEKTVFVAVVNIGSFYETFDLTKHVSLPEPKLVVYTSSMNCEHKEDEAVDASAIKLRPKAGVVLSNQKNKVD
ncbi:unnamed protein product [Bemisia tabaci]|uniref:alpha-glucosidase n=1 Tax=Bemisia tabaci TaxID=7038 RepID=A0A9P0CDN9_BEMTA|nr:unnamed protein product [Bemisia tabaci]